MLESVLSQSFKQWELIVVDDGSEDSTADIVDEYAASDPRIRLASRGKRLGKAAAFNLAYAASTGECFVMLSGDDRLPADSLAVRWAAVSAVPEEALGLASFKLRTISGNRALEGMVLPRGHGASLSGGVLTMNRALAEVVFPVPEELPSEDIWLGEAASAVAQYHHKGQEVVLEYRMHPGNSNPRMKSFEVMSISIARRLEAYRLLAEDQRLPTTRQQRADWMGLYKLELLRRDGRTWKVLQSPSSSPIRRVAVASMSNRLLWWVRRTFYRSLSGWQGR